MAAEKKKTQAKVSGFAIPGENYKFLILGFIIVIIGFLLMVGGGSNDPKIFNKDMFSTRRIIIAPIVVIFGFAFEIWAIMRKPKSNVQL